jgi:DIL domain
METKKRLAKMVIPALIESQSLPGFTTTDGGGRLFNRLLNSNSQPAFSMDDVLNLLNKVWKALKSFYMEESVVQQVVIELLRLVGVTSFNDLLMRRNFCSWKRGKDAVFGVIHIFAQALSRFSHANSVQHYSDRRMVQVARHARRYFATRAFDAGHQTTPVEEGMPVLDACAAIFSDQDCFVGIICRYSNHLRRLLDPHSITDPKDVQQLFRR